MISIMVAYVAGLKLAWQQKKMLFLIYPLNVLLAYLLASPISGILNAALDYPTAADKMLHVFDYTYFISIFRDFGTVFNINSTLLAFGILTLVLNSFLTGGILFLYHQEVPYSIKSFLSGAVDYFSRFLRLLGFALILIILSIVMVYMLDLLLDTLTENVSNGMWSVSLNFLRIFILMMAIVMINMLFDYAKIITVVNDLYGMYQAVKIALMFVMMSMRKTLILYLLYFGTAILITMLYLWIQNGLQGSSGWTILLFTVVTQLYILLKYWLRLAFFGGQFVFYKYSNTAMPGMSKKMLDDAVEDYKKRIQKNS